MTAQVQFGISLRNELTNSKLNMSCWCSSWDVIRGDIRMCAREGELDWRWDSNSAEDVGKVDLFVVEVEYYCDKYAIRMLRWIRETVRETELKGVGKSLIACLEWMKRNLLHSFGTAIKHEENWLNPFGRRWRNYLWLLYLSIYATYSGIYFRYCDRD